jgi:hypothetical protein
MQVHSLKENAAGGVCLMPFGLLAQFSSRKFPRMLILYDIWLAFVDVNEACDAFRCRIFLAVAGVTGFPLSFFSLFASRSVQSVNLILRRFSHE